MSDTEHSQRAVSEIEQEAKMSIDVIIQDCQKHSWRTLPKRQIAFIKQQIRETISAYPPKLRPLVTTIIVVCYLSIIPGTGVASVIIFGGIGKLLTRLKNT